MGIGYILAWIGLSILVGFVGSSRKIGFAIALIISLIFSPLIGIICVLLSKDNQTDAVEKAFLQNNLEQSILKTKPTSKDYETLEEAFRRKLISANDYERRKALLRKADEQN
ncbi:hypothetical protein ACTJIJ_22920 [Niabella sp. 22666]|uniref:hypothetical protein n=1 Tax=Niabella sp. 22666 TaxID=3453954 RepID=UPI003F858535